MAWPATKIDAPAAAMASMFDASTPPSISMGADEPAAASTARTRRILSRLCGMNFCPPNPGFTDITTTKSRSAAMASSAEAGVDGLSTAPAWAPSARMKVSVRWRCGTASTCTDTMLAPALTKASM